MIRRAYIIGILAIGLTACAVQTYPLVDRVVSSAQSFHGYFRELGHAGTSLKALERLVFSLVLTRPMGSPEANIRQAPKAREVENRGPVTERHT